MLRSGFRPCTDHGYCHSASKPIHSSREAGLNLSFSYIFVPQYKYIYRFHIYYAYCTNELLIILVVVLLIFGPKNLPKLGKMFGKTINGFKKGMEDEDAEQSEETVKKADKKDEDEE